MMKRPAPLDRRMDGMLPAEKHLAMHVMLATGDWPKNDRASLVGLITAALDEAYQKGIDATIEANDVASPVCEIDALHSAEWLARTAIVLDAGGGTMKPLRLSPSERVIAWRLVEPRCVSAGELVEALWADRPDGGAEFARPIVRTHIFNMGRKLAPLGVEIVNRYGFGWFVMPAQLERFRDLIADEIARNTRRGAGRWTPARPPSALSPDLRGAP